MQLCIKDKECLASEVSYVGCFNPVVYVLREAEVSLKLTAGNFLVVFFIREASK